MFLLCSEKPRPFGQVIDRWLCPGVLCLKKERRTSNFQRRIKVRLRRFNFIKEMSDPPASPEGEADGGQERYPHSMFDVERSMFDVHLFHAKQIPSGDSQSLVLWARILYFALCLCPSVPE